MTSRPRIGIDAHILDGKAQGSATYLFRLLKELAQISTDFDTFVYCGTPDVLRSRLADPPFIFRRLRSRSSVIRLALEFPYLLKRDSISLGVFQFVTPIFGSTPTAVVVHDLLPFTHGHLFPITFRTNRKILFSRSINRASAICAVSQYSASQIKAFFPGTVEVTVTPNGPSFETTDLFLPKSHSNEAERFILAVGRIEKRKNISLLAEAFLRANLPSIKLIIVGSRDLGFEWENPDPSRITHLQNVSSAELLRLYQSASLFVFPSSAEGFGIPLLDALLAGIPTISSDRTAMKEIAGSAATFFNPDDQRAVSCLAELITDHFCGEGFDAPAMAERLTLADKYSWKSTAQTFVRAISEAIERKSGQR